MPKIRPDAEPVVTKPPSITPQELEILGPLIKALAQMAANQLAKEDAVRRAAEAAASGFGLDRLGHDKAILGWRTADRNQRLKMSTKLELLAVELRDAVARAPSGDRVVAIHLFGIRNAGRLDGENLQELAERAGIGRSYGTELRKGVRLAEHVYFKG